MLLSLTLYELYLNSAIWNFVSRSPTSVLLNSIWFLPITADFNKTIFNLDLPIDAAPTIAPSALSSKPSYTEGFLPAHKTKILLKHFCTHLLASPSRCAFVVGSPRG